MRSQSPVFRYLSHPQVVIDPDIPVSRWGLSATGKRRTEALCRSAVLAGTTRVVASSEVKAMETGSILASAIGVALEVRDDMHENDRTSTGYLESAEFEAMRVRFFAEPDKSVRGWERAVDAQRRIVGATERILAGHGDGDLMIVGHGAVGTLLYCHYAHLPIDGAHDQPPGGGNVFAVSIPERQVVHGWRPMEEIRPA